MENVYVGDWGEGERRLVDQHIKGWALTKAVRLEDARAFRDLYQAEFGAKRLNASSLAELIEQAEALPSVVGGTIVPTRTTKDSGYPKQYDPLPEEWETSLMYESERNRVKLLKLLGR